MSGTTTPITTRTGMFRGNAINSATVADVQGLLTEAAEALSGITDTLATVTTVASHANGLQASLDAAAEQAISDVSAAAATAQAGVSAAAQSVQGLAQAVTTASATAQTAAAQATAAVNEAILQAAALGGQAPAARPSFDQDGTRGKGLTFDMSSSSSVLTTTYIPTWTTATRPSLVPGQVALGFNMDGPQLELGIGDAATPWNPIGAGA